MPGLKIFLLGPPRIECDGAPVSVRRRKAVALLAYLAVTGQGYSRDALATLLWPEHDQQRARANLRVALATLNRAIGEGWLQVDRENIQLDARADQPPDSTLWLDVSAFRHHVAVCRAHNDPLEETCPSCLSSLAEAVGIYRDHFLAGFTLRDSPAFDEWQFFESESMRSELVYAIERLARAYSQEGAYETALPYARRWLALDPLHEPAHRLLMQLYAWSGQQAAALRQYGECERMLGEEMGVGPGEETTRLYERIRGGVEQPPPSVDRRETLPTSLSADVKGSPSLREQRLPPTVPKHPHNLPAQATGFIGRESQLAEVEALLARPDVRLVTLTGTGGVGKTRLSLQVAAECVEGFPAGVFFVPLASIDELSLVVPAIASALGMRRTEHGSFTPSPDLDIVQRLEDHLRDKVVLLVLDNLEQVLSAGPVVGELLTAVPGLKVLATSRAPLQVYGEHVYSVPPMVTPDPWALPSRDALLRLEAVELFVQRARAARSGFEITDENATAVAGICARLAGLPLAIELAAARVRLLPLGNVLERLDDALGFLVGGATDLPDRQRTLRAAIDWSHALLDEPERVLFRRLAVFAGGGSLEAVEAVSDAPGDVDLLAALQGLVDKSMLQASQVGGEARFVMLETIREYARERLETDAPDERKAIRRRHARHFLALAEQAEPERWSAEQVAWADRLGIEYDNLRAALAWSLDNGIEIGLRLAGALEWFWNTRVYRREGRTWLRSLLDRSSGCAEGMFPWRAKALDKAGRLALQQRDFEQAALLLNESIDLWHQVGDARGLAYALADLGIVRYEERALIKARALTAQAIDLFREADDRIGLAHTLFWHGLATWRAGGHAEASSSAKEAVHLGERIDSPQIVAHATSVLGRIALNQDQHAAARTYLERSLALFRERGDVSRSWPIPGWLGTVLYQQGEVERAEAVWEEALTTNREALGAPWMLYSLGYISLRRAHWQKARALFTESLTLYLHPGTEKQEIAACLVGLAGVAAQRGCPKRAARLLAAVDVLLDVIGKDLYPVNQGDHDRILQAVRSELDEKAFAAAWDEGQAMTFDQAAEYALTVANIPP